MLLRAVVLAAIVAPIAGCDSNAPGTTISITSNDSDGNTIASVDGATGQVKIDVAGFKGSLKMPKITLDASGVDLNGVKLYPGSTIGAMNFDGQGEGKGGENEGTVRITFDSPAEPGIVRAWFAERLPKAGFTIRREGAGLTGTTDEKKPFSLKLAPTGEGHAAGTIIVG